MRHLIAVLLPSLAAVALAASCVSSTSETLDEARMGLLVEGTYAWIEEPIQGPEGSLIEASDELEAEARAALDAELASRGFRIVDERDAAVFMSLRLDVSRESRSVDPFFAQDQLERYENGHLTAAAFVPVTYEPIWRARSEVKLRTTAQGMGTMKIVWKQLEEERDWQMARLAKAVVGRLP